MSKSATSYKTVNFYAADGLEITTDYYAIRKPKGLMLLCHRSHCNRAEYRETAPRFNKLGYSCLALDQRSGMKIFGEVNETKNRAKALGLPTGYLDAKPDIVAGIAYAYQLNKNKPILLLGSSYSAALALLLSVGSDKIKATIAFSPGEYLKGINLAEKIAAIDKPTFVTSPKAEITQVTEVMKNATSEFVTQFKPQAEGFHGSKTLWKSVVGSETYWRALEKFLQQTGS
jgi:alpha-beta hydrolase superfamily lysophospholipase